jgi:GNAT superfamily N-acetyltransferase
MSIETKEVKTRKQLREFIYLPARIHRNHINWVPPFYSEEWKYFNPKKNKAFSYCDVVLLLAYRNCKAVGRVMGIINHRYNNYREERNGRFAYLECREDQEVGHELLKYVEKWARAKGMDKIVGPLGFSDQDPEGYLIEGFDFTPTLSTYYNFEYLIQLLEKEGYAKEVDYVVYKVNLLKEIPEFYGRIYKRISKKKGFALVEFSKKKQLKAHIRPIFYLMNDCFRNIYGYLPLDEKEMDKLAKRYLAFVDPRFIKIVINNDKEVIGFIIGIPNLSEGIRKARGRLFPFGIFLIFRSAKKTKQLDLMLGGIKEEYRGRGVDAILGMKIMESARKAGFECVDSHHELESNYKMHAEMERIGGKVYKRFRIFQKKL